MNVAMPHTDWDAEVASLLDELSEAQSDLLAALLRKRDCLAQGDADGLAALSAAETRLAGRLQACHTRRGELLKKAAAEGLPSDSVQSLAGALPSPAGGPNLTNRVREASHRSRLLQHHSLANWVVAQRTLLHLAQVLEIIATGGQGKPTYSKRDALAGGALLDQAV